MIYLYVPYSSHISEHHSDIRAVAVCVDVWVVCGAVGVGGAGVGGFWVVWACWVMEPRNTLNTRKCGWGRNHEIHEKHEKV